MLYERLCSSQQPRLEGTRLLAGANTGRGRGAAAPRLRTVAGVFHQAPMTGGRTDTTEGQPVFGEAEHPIWSRAVNESFY